MTTKYFNNKWMQYLQPGYSGMDANNPIVIRYLDDEFEKEVKVNPSFSFGEIKLKFGDIRIYANSDKIENWEKEINKMLGNREVKFWELK